MNVKKKISVVAPCFNEKENLPELYDKLTSILRSLDAYDYEIIIADNNSQDGSREFLKNLASHDKRLKLILNSNNFGQRRSPYNVILSATGDAVIAIAADLQDPPQLIPEMIKLWESGYDVVVAVKKASRERKFLFYIRKLYYSFLEKSSDSNYIIKNFTGYGLYSKKVVQAFKKFTDPDPYFRGIVGEVGFRRVELPYVQDVRKKGYSKNNLFSLYDYAMTGFVNHSKLPLRLATFAGFCLAGLSLLVSFGYLIYKILYWKTFYLGVAPVVIGLFFFSAIQLIFIGIIGEYIGAILTYVKNHPLVIEEERINFDD